jgi:hypothetical protein
LHTAALTTARRKLVLYDNQTGKHPTRGALLIDRTLDLGVDTMSDDKRQADIGPTDRLLNPEEGWTPFMSWRHD